MRYTIELDLVGSTVTETWSAPDVETAMRLAVWAHPDARSMTVTGFECETTDPWPTVLPGVAV